MQTQLLFTKLYAPPFLPSRVSRARLTDQISRSIHDGLKLVLLAAPAGSGKTVILSEWMAQCPVNSTWLSLDEGDNDPVRFWDYVVAALQKFDARIGQASLPLLHEPTPLPIQSILVTLINEIGAVPDHFALVLDDYHVVNAPAIHEGLAFLLDRLPPTMHIVMTTRNDPPLPLARLRARNELLELRASDLQFNAVETSHFVSRLTGIQLEANALKALNTRTEGWAAGLQLAALAMRGHDNPGEFINNFAGDNRFILEYLGDEVLDRQPLAVQQFLMRTSILNQLSGDLCAAVAGESNAQTMLDALERSNFFIQPADDRRRWYRYHQLFRDFLQHRLQQQEANQIEWLHQRASAWFEQHGYLSEAIHHALAMRDYERAARLVESIAEFLIWRRAELHTLQEWLGALPDALIRTRPRLALYHAWTLYLTNRMDSAMERIRAAEQAIERAAQPDNATEAPESNEGNIIAGMLYAVQSTLTGIRQDFAATLQTGRLALAHLPDSEIAWRCMAAINLGVTCAAIGEMDEAIQTLHYAMELSQEIGSGFALLSAFWHLATLQTAQLRLRDAEQTCYQLQSLAEAPGVQRFPVGGYIALLLAEIMLERNQLAEAESYFMEGAQQINPDGFPLALLRCYTGLIRLRRAQNDAEGAEEWFRRAEQLERVSKLRNRSSAFGAYRGWRFILEGDLQSGWRWAEENHLELDNDFSYYLESYYLVLARLLIATAENSPERLQDAQRLLERMVHRADSSGRPGSLVRALSLQALAFDLAGNTDSAVEALVRATMLAEPEQYIRTFADEGPGMARLIQKTLEKQRRATNGGSLHPSPVYLAAILSAMGVHHTSVTPVPKRTSKLLVEQLSERELEVLRLLADGLSSNEIAGRLIISVETARKHIKNIYGKLDVHSQFEAARRAQELGLL
jgi:LuxR family transcriptional regulator, maltose regulon positive regulatory protein